MSELKIFKMLDKLSPTATVLVSVNRSASVQQTRDRRCCTTLQRAYQQCHTHTLHSV